MADALSKKDVRDIVASAEQGVVTEVEQRAEGSSLVAAASTGDDFLVVEYGGDFDDAGGTLQLNGQTMAYTAVIDGATPDDPDTIQLGAMLAADAAVDDWVYVMAGEQRSYEYVAHVSVDEQGDASEVVIPYAQRAFWPVGPYDPPVPVTVSNDLSQILDTPGRTPVPSIVLGDPDAEHMELDSTGLSGFDASGDQTFSLVANLLTIFGAGDIHILDDNGDTVFDALGGPLKVKTFQTDDNTAGIPDDSTWRTYADTHVTIPNGFDKAFVLLFASAGITFSGAGTIGVQPMMAVGGPGISNGSSGGPCSVSSFMAGSGSGLSGSAYLDVSLQAYASGARSGGDTGNVHLSGIVVFTR